MKRVQGKRAEHAAKSGSKAGSKTGKKTRSKIRPGKKAKPSKVSIKSTVKKVVDILTAPFQGDQGKPKRKPFGGKGGRRKKQPEPPTPSVETDDIAEAGLERRRDEFEYSMFDQNMVGSDPVNDFFYTTDKFITQFEDREIFQFIKDRHPEFMADQNSDVKIKNSIVALLKDQDFVKEILDRYDITIMEFFKFLFRLDFSVFKKPFLNKLNKLVKSFGYSDL